MSLRHATTHLGVFPLFDSSLTPADIMKASYPVRDTAVCLRILFLALILSSGSSSVEESADDEYAAEADDPIFWDRTYRVHGEHGRQSYEWYGLGFGKLQEHLSELLPPKGGRVLVVGAGDSELSSALAALHYEVTSIDFSEEVTKRMRAHHPQLEFLTMDARDMSFPDQHFQAVIDKGLSDCLGSGKDLRAYFQEVGRVLDGMLIVISMRKLSPKLFKRGWRCLPRRELMGPQFEEVSEFKPAQRIKGSDGTIPYYLASCRKVSGKDEI